MAHSKKKPHQNIHPQLIHLTLQDNLVIKDIWPRCSRMKKLWGNCQKQFVFVTRSCTCFQSFGDHSNMSAENAIEKLQIIMREKEVQRTGNRRKQQEEAKL